MRNPKEGRTRVPKSKDLDGMVEYWRNTDGFIVSRINYPCGCEYDITWIKSGHYKDIETTMFCADHDPTTKENEEPFHFQ